MWTNTTLESPTWSDETQEWTVTLIREKDGKQDKSNVIFQNTIPITNVYLGILHPRHVILATGHSGEPYLPSNIAGMNDFKGDRLIHSAYFTQPDKTAKGKKAIVVGCCNSGE